ncbi:hypothetical protein C8035_v007680 [Colletotrichum spinosum]|uniref:Uncharacterized protein n=1 Tax=Colletotrichum spinosum TaxID=1347390 RepID=A0A4R8QMW0_9PEZI|nr:hypothetical protein C8035_v007680 [Colletotrichum spinosum]
MPAISLSKPSDIAYDAMRRRQPTSSDTGHLDRRESGGRGSNRENASLIFVAVACTVVLAGLIFWYTRHRRNSRERASRERYMHIAMAHEARDHRRPQPREDESVYGRGVFPGYSYGNKR